MKHKGVSVCCCVCFESLFHFCCFFSEQKVLSTCSWRTSSSLEIPTLFRSLKMFSARNVLPHLWWTRSASTGVSTEEEDLRKKNKSWQKRCSWRNFSVFSSPMKEIDLKFFFFISASRSFLIPLLPVSVIPLLSSFSRLQHTPVNTHAQLFFIKATFSFLVCQFEEQTLKLPSCVMLTLSVTKSLHTNQ